MGPFLADAWSRSRSLCLGGALAVALAATLIPTPTKQPAPQLRTWTGCQQPRAVQPDSHHLYVRVVPTDYGKGESLDDRALTVALLTVAEHPRWQIHLASDEIGGELIPGYRLSVTLTNVTTTSNSIECTASATLEHYPVVKPLNTVEGSTVVYFHTSDGKAWPAIQSTCVTGAVEDVVEAALRGF